MKKTKTSPKNKKYITLKKSQKYPVAFIAVAILINFIIFKNIIIGFRPTLTQAILVSLIIFLLNYTALRLFEDVKKVMYSLRSLLYMTLPLWTFLIFCLIIIY